MREIKFRAYDEERKRMVQILNLYADSDGQIIRFLGHKKGEPGDFEACPEDSAVMQFTGLKDKNGKEIYESDIIRLEIYKGLITETEVVHRGGCWCVIGNPLFEYDDAVVDKKGIQVEVLGNIYENPELLEG